MYEKHIGTLSPVLPHFSLVVALVIASSHRCEFATMTSAFVTSMCLCSSSSRLSPSQYDDHGSAPFSSSSPPQPSFGGGGGSIVRQSAVTQSRPQSCPSSAHPCHRASK